MIPMTKQRKIDGLSSGSVMRLNRIHVLAPSIAADS
jgi:hypothetical protein